jgi:hypothetical protein
MLSIRPIQLRILEDNLLHRWVAGELTNLAPAEMSTFSPGQLNALLNGAISSARALGLQLPVDLLAYAHIVLLVGPLEDDPGLTWTKEYLDDWDPDIGARIARLQAEVVARYKGI